MSYKITQLPSVPAGTITEQISIPVSKTGTDPKTYKMSLQQTVAWLQGQGIGVGTQGTAGTQGSTGSGTQGTQGGAGTGTQGGNGTQGSIGGLGAQGATGTQGLPGPQGPNGIPGSSGYSGFDGNSGYSGFIGSSGYSGVDGNSGYSGFTGSSGFSGVAGASGYSGSPGSNTGLPGPGLVYTGYYRGTGYTYYSSLNRKDIASYSGAQGLTYYLANSNTLSGDSGNTGWPTPGTTSDWTTFGNTFESVATDLLLANDIAVTRTITLGQVGVASQGIIRSANADWVGTPNASGFWLGSDVDGNARFFIGNYSPGGNYLIYDSANGILSLSGTLYADAGSIGGVGIAQGKIYTGLPGGAGTLDTPVFINGSADPGGNTGRTHFTLGDRLKYYRVSGASTPTTYFAISGIVTATAGSIGGVGIGEAQIYTGDSEGAGTAATPFYLNGSYDNGSSDRTYFTLGNTLKYFRAGGTNYMNVSGGITATRGSIGGVGIETGHLYTGAPDKAGTNDTPLYINGNVSDLNTNQDQAIFYLGDSFKWYKKSGASTPSYNFLLGRTGLTSSYQLSTTGNYLFWNGATGNLELSGVLYANAGKIAGWTLNQSTLFSNNNTVALEGGYSGASFQPPYISVGTSNYSGTGIWMGLNGGAYKMSIKGGFGNDGMVWDGNSLDITGAINITGGQAQTDITNATNTANTAQSTANTAAGVANGVSGTVVTLDGKVFTDANGKIVKVPTTGSAGLFLGSGYMGYHDGGNWKTYMANNGNFYLDGPGNDFLSWAQGVLSVQGTVNASKGAIGGWVLGASQVQSTNNEIVLNSSTPYIGVQTTAFNGNGVFLGKSGSNYVFSAGNGSSNYMKWDGTQLSVKGGIYVEDQVGLRRTDNLGSVIITGGSDNGNSNGGQIDLVGNSNSTFPGVAQLMAGNVSTGHVYLKTANDQYRITCLYNGKVGIRTSNPTQGDFEVQGDTYINGTLDVVQGVTAASYNTSSSRKFKTNIAPIVGAVGIVEKLQGVTFDWKTKDIKDDFGLIAEEVNEVLPTIVSKDEKGEPNAVDYGRLTALLIETVKDLNNRVKYLESKLAK